MLSEKTKVLQTRISADLMAEVEPILDEMGTTPTDAVRMFFVNIRNTGVLPFIPGSHVPNDETMAALRDFRGGRHGRKMSEGEFGKYLDDLEK